MEEIILLERGWSKQNGTVIFCEAAQKLNEVLKGWREQNKRVAMGCKQITIVKTYKNIVKTIKSVFVIVTVTIRQMS